MADGRILWAGLLAIVILYTGWVVSRNGWNSVSPYYAAIARGDWQGQFNTDFHGMLILSAWWVAWREGWSGRGLLRALSTLGRGAPSLRAYLFLLSLQRDATPEWLMTGNRAERKQ